MRVVLGVLFSSLLLVACGGDGEDAALPTAADSTETTATLPANTEAASPVDPSPAPGSTVEYRLGVPSGAPYTPTDPSFEALPGAEAITGTLGAAVYRIEMPGDWNGDLVLYAHGYRGEGNQLTVSSPPQALRQLLIEQGYAWAASSYSENGYVPGLGADDTLALKKEFVAQTGSEPRRTYLYGESMGGNVISLSLEHYPDEYDGALAVCGALGGQEQIDFLASWAMLAEYTSGQSIPIGEVNARIDASLLLQLANVLGSPDQPTEAGTQFLSAIRMLTGGPRPFFLEGFTEQYVANFGFLLIDPGRRSPVTRASTNDGAVYEIEDGLGLTSEQLNGEVRRIHADPTYRDAGAYPDKVPTSGNIADPLLTLHNTGDLFVPISHEVDYLAKAQAAGVADNLVQRAIRAGGHCNFSEAELTTAWNDLVAWVEDGTRPAGDDLSGDLSDIGMAFTNPLRPGDPGSR